MLINIFLFITCWTTINSIFTEDLDKKTKFISNNTFDVNKYYILDPHFKFLFLFGGIFCYLFLNIIRKRRKIYFYKSKLKFLNQLKKFETLIDMENENLNNEILKVNRKLKLIKLK